MNISFIIPVYNAAKFLPACLKSIRDQDYPTDKIEILVADGGSEDKTREIASQFGATIIANPARLGEAGKLEALKRATGEAIVFMDADNEIVGPLWLKKSVDALTSSDNLLGVEAFYTAHPADSSLNHYLTTFLHINDPIAYKMAAQLQIVEEDEHRVIYEIQPPYNFPTGANGFMFLRSTLNKVYQEEDFHESEWSRKLIQMGHCRLAMVKGCGVAHHYVSSLSDFWRKRKHAGSLYLKRRKNYGSSWFMARGKLRLIFICLWYSLLIPSLFEAIWKGFRDRSSAWLWHPIVGIISLANHVSTFLIDSLLPAKWKERRIYTFAAAAQNRK
jgi:glycosyltransferase involved in cell wall biosynthesis